MIARILAVMLGCALGMGVFGVGEVIVMTGNNPFETDVRAMPDGPGYSSFARNLASEFRPYGEYPYRREAR